MNFLRKINNLALICIFLINTNCATAQTVAPASNIPSWTGPIIEPTLPPVSTFPDLSNYSNTDDRNFVRTYTPHKATTDPNELSIDNNTSLSEIHTTYYDGLGRPLQEIQQGSWSTAYSDLVAVHTYDAIGRESYKYLPFSTNDANNHSKLKTTPLNTLSTQYNGLYNGQEPYRKVEYDNSPQNKVSRVLAPGHSWVGSNRGKEITYGTNTTSFFTKIFKYSYSSLGILGLPTLDGEYDVNQLFSNKVVDEDGTFSITYKDKEGKLIAKMTSYSETSNSYSPNLYKEYNITYYVYDDASNLRFVISPEAYKASWLNSGNITMNIADNLCYQYAYDTYGRMIAKKQAGKEAEYFIYDKRNRPVLTQDGNMRKNGKNDWFFTIYDAMDRVVNTGIYSAPAWYEPYTLAGFLDNTSSSNQFTTSQLMYYLTHTDENYVRIFALDNCLIYTTNLYDDYNHPAFSMKPFTYFYNGQLTGSQSVASITSQSALYRGLKTGQFVRILDNANYQQWTLSNPVLFSAYYYDDKERLIQTQTDTHVNGTDVQTMQYDFAGTLLSSVYNHTNPNAISPESAFPNMMHQTTIVKRYTPDYIGGGINTKLEQRVNNSGFTLLNNLGFDALHRVNYKSQNVATNSYTYNIRNWITGINPSYLFSNNASRFFSEQIFYDDGNTFPSKLYNGNISGVIWKGFGSQAQARSYGYSYDHLNRLTDAMFNERRPITVQPNNSTIYQWDHDMLDYTMSNVKYDYNGNILQMNQRGTNTSGGTPIDMDKLTYHYAPNSNTLINVDDAATIPTTNPDFKDYNNNSGNGDDYLYDDNGNLLTDLNKNIYSITYNYFNKPQFLSAGLGSIEYIYDGLGNKLEKIVTPIQVSQINPDNKVDYVGPFVYEKNNLKLFGHEEGRCRPVQTSTTGIPNFYYDYFVKDHQNNVRSIVNLTTAYPEEFFANPFQFTSGNKVYTASHEVSLANTENLVWSNIDEVRDDKPDPTNWDEKAARLDGMDDMKRIGTAIMLRVMPGDEFKLSADSYHKDYTPDSTASTADMLSSLLATLAGGSMINGQTVAEVPENVNVINNTLSNPNLAGQYENLINANIDSTQPLAFLNYLVFDEHFNLVKEQSGAIQVSGNPEEWSHMSLDDVISIGQSGYLSVFISSQAKIPVHFDHVSLYYFKGNVLEENHYYPYGLTISTTTNNPLEKNNIKYSSKELQSDAFINTFSSAVSDNVRLETYDFGARMQDPQIGRWWQMDPLAELAHNFSPYNYTLDNPVRFIDPTGLCPTDNTRGAEPDRTRGKGDDGDDSKYTGEDGGTAVGDIIPWTGPETELEGLHTGTSIGDLISNLLNSLGFGGNDGFRGNNYDGLLCDASSSSWTLDLMLQEIANKQGSYNNPYVLEEPTISACRPDNQSDANHVRMDIYSGVGLGIDIADNVAIKSIELGAEAVGYEALIGSTKALSTGMGLTNIFLTGLKVYSIGNGKWTTADKIDAAMGTISIFVTPIGTIWFGANMASMLISGHTMSEYVGKIYDDGNYLYLLPTYVH